MKSEYMYAILILAVVLGAYYYYTSSDFQLKCIVAGANGNKFCVREREKIQEAANLLAAITEKCKKLVKYLETKHPNNENVRRLVDNFNPQRVVETLPTSTYTAYSENKGEKIAFCLNKKKHDDTVLIDEHTLMFVAIHELAHVGNEGVGHKSDFWEYFKFLLVNAKEAGLHEPVDYSKQSQEYCDMTIKDNPYYEI